MSPNRVVLGLDFGGTKIAAAVADPTGARLASVTVDSVAAQGATACLDRGLRTALELLARTAPQATLAAVGVCTFGIPGEDGVDLAPAIPGWQQLPLRRSLGEAFPGVPVRLANDVKAAAAAELRWGALAGCDPAIYLNLGTGLAAALCVGGTVVRGARGAAGEIGYNLRSTADVGTSSPHTLEDAVSGRALAALAGAEVGRPMDAAEVFGLSDVDPRARLLVDAFLRELSLHVVNLAVAVDPVRIAVGGGMVRAWRRIGPVLRNALDAAAPFPPELVPATFPDDAPLIGALALAVEALPDGEGGMPARRIVPPNPLPARQGAWGTSSEGSSR